MTSDTKSALVASRAFNVRVTGTNGFDRSVWIVATTPGEAFKKTYVDISKVLPGMKSPGTDRTQITGIVVGLEVTVLQEPRE